MELVLLPGMDGTGMLFQPLIRVLGENIKINIVQYPCNEELSYNELCVFVKERLPRRQEFILVAESFSGPIAYRLATESIPNLKSIIFVASFLEAPRPILLSVLKLLPLTFFFRIPIPDLITKQIFLGPNASPSLVKLFKEALGQVKPSVLAYRLRAISSLKASGPALQIPCCYIQAKSDMLVPVKSFQPFERLIPQIKVYRIEGPHFVIQANPESCARIIQKEINP